MHCDGAVVALAGAGDDGALAPLFSRHVAGCLRCQASRARHRHLLRLLAQLRTEHVAPPPGVLASVLEALAAAGEDVGQEPGQHGHPWRASLAAGVGALAVALLTGWARLARQGAVASRCYR